MIEAFLNLKGRTNEAMNYYEGIFGGINKEVMTLGDMLPNPDYPIPDEMKELIAHAQMTIRGTIIHFSDTQPDAVANGMISLMVSFDTEDELMEVYNKLMDGGSALMEPEPQFYAKLFG